MDRLAYKPHGAEIAERLARLWRREAQDEIFARILLPSPALLEFKRTHEDGATTYPDPEERIRFWDAHLEFEGTIEDDWLPIAYLSEFDEGLYAGLCGGEMHYMTHTDVGWISSMCPPCLPDIRDVDDLHIDEDHPLLGLLDRQVALFREGARGKFGVAPFIVIDALNFVAELRGMTQAFEDVMDHPAAVRKMMSFALELNQFVQDRVLDALDTFQGGTFCNMGSWAPGRDILFSVDAYHMAHPDYFEEWGRPYIQSLLDHYDGGLLHLHSNGLHLLPTVRTLNKLVCVYLLDEAWNPPAYERLSEHHQTADGVPLVVSCRYEEFVRDLEAHRLPGNVLYKIREAPSVEAGNRLMEKVRAYRA